MRLKKKHVVSSTTITKREWIGPTLLIMPFLVLFFLFTILPILASAVLSLTSYDMINAPAFNGISNYIRLFLYDDIFQIALTNTLVFSVVTGPLSFFLCFMLAWFINDLPPFLRNVVSFIFYSPALAGNAYFIWQYIFSGDSFGMFNNFLMTFGFITEPVQWFKSADYALPLVMLVQLWLSLGVSFLSNIAGLQNVGQEMYEAGVIDGIRNRWQELWYITLPSMKNILLFSAVMQIQSSFSVSGVATTLTGNPSTNYVTHTIVTHMTDYGSTRYEMGYASAIAVVLFVIMAVARILIDKLMNAFGSED